MLRYKIRNKTQKLIILITLGVLFRTWFITTYNIPLQGPITSTFVFSQIILISSQHILEFFSPLFIEVYMVKCTILCSLMNFDVCIYSRNHHLDQDSKHAY